MFVLSRLPSPHPASSLKKQKPSATQFLQDLFPRWPLECWWQAVAPWETGSEMIAALTPPCPPLSLAPPDRNWGARLSFTTVASWCGNSADVYCCWVRRKEKKLLQSLKSGLRKDLRNEDLILGRTQWWITVGGSFSAGGLFPQALRLCPQGPQNTPRPFGQNFKVWKQSHLSGHLGNHNN